MESRSTSGFGSALRVTMSRERWSVSISIWYQEDISGNVFMMSSIWLQKRAPSSDLALGVAGADGDGGAAGGDAAVVSAEAAGKEAVAIADLHDVVLVAVGVVDGVREALAPDLYVVLGVGAHGRDAGRARRNVDLTNVLERRGEGSNPASSKLFL